MEKWLARRLGPAPKDDWTLMLAEYCGTVAPSFRQHHSLAEEACLPAE